MSVSIRLSQHAEVIQAGSDYTYRLTSSADEAQTIEPAVFLFDYTNQTYQHVCTVGDLLTYPSTRTEGVAYYRQAQVVLGYATANELSNEMTLQQQRLQNLVTDYKAYIDSGVFGPDPVIHTYTAS